MAILTRPEIGQKLRAIDPKASTYFQPPDGKRIEYPCFIYSREVGRTVLADNMRYGYAEGYSVLYITRDPDSKIPLRVLDGFQYCSDGKPYVKDNLYHYPFTIYNK